MGGLWIIWQWYDPKRLLVMLYVFLAGLAFTIHFILLSTERYNWLETPRVARKASLVIEPDPVMTKFIVKTG
jgi:light-harvesting complex 1 alpha chain